MKEMTLLLDKYYTQTIPREYLKIAMLEALKFCIPTSKKEGRALPWLFTVGGASTLSKMETIVTPMGGSVGLLKKTKAKGAAIGEGRGGGVSVHPRGAGPDE